MYNWYNLRVREQFWLVVRKKFIGFTKHTTKKDKQKIFQIWNKNRELDSTNCCYVVKNKWQAAVSF